MISGSISKPKSIRNIKAVYMYIYICMNYLKMFSEM